MSEVKKSCSNCGNRCMDMSVDPYCIAVNKPWGQALFRGHPKECGPDFRLWAEDTRDRPTFCKLCKKPKAGFQVFCGAACSVEWESGKRP